MENCIKERRAARGLSREALARELGVTRVTVFKWEEGFIDVPWRQIERIARFFQLTPVDLFPPFSRVPTPEKEPAHVG